MGGVVVWQLGLSPALCDFAELCRWQSPHSGTPIATAVQSSHLTPPQRTPIAVHAPLAMSSPLRQSLLAGDPPPSRTSTLRSSSRSHRANGSHNPYPRPTLPPRSRPINHSSSSSKPPPRSPPPPPSFPTSPRSPPLTPPSPDPLSSPSPSTLRLFVLSHLPILRWLPSYSLRADLIGDLLAGLTVGLMVVPQAMAYAQIAGLPVLTGLYSALLGCVLYAPFGTSKDLNVGPTSVLSLLVLSSYLGPATLDGDPGLPSRLSQAAFLSLYAGLWQLLFGLLRLGRVLDFISHPVISAFTSASALTIASVQIKNLTGIKVGSTFLVNAVDVVTNARQFQWRDATLGVACMALLAGLARLRRYRREEHFALWLLCTARNALTVMAATTLSMALMLTGHTPFVTIPIIAGSSPHLPALSLTFFTDPDVRSTPNLPSYTLSAIAIACIGILEGIAVAKSFAKANGYSATLDPSQELIATGAIQAVGAFFGCYPVGGSFSRTAVNSQAGIRTPLGGVFAGGVLLLALLFATPAFHYIPQSALAAVIIMAVSSIIDFDIFVSLYRMGEPMPTRRSMPGGWAGWLLDFVLVVVGGWLYVPFCLLYRRRQSPAPQAWWDLLTLLVAFWGCLLLSIEWGIALAVLVSLGLTVQRASDPIVQRLHWLDGDWVEVGRGEGEGEESAEEEVQGEGERGGGEEARLTRSRSEEEEAVWVQREVLAVRVQGPILYFSVNAVLQQLRLHEQRGGYIDHVLTPAEEAADEEAKHRSEDEDEEEALGLEGEEGGKGLGVGGDVPPSLRPDPSLATLREVEEGLESVRLPHLSSRLRWVLVDLQAVNDVDSSGMHGLEVALREYRGRRWGEEVEVVWVGAQEPVRRFLVRAWEEEGVAVVGEADEVRSWFVRGLREGMDHVRRSRAERLGTTLDQVS